MRTRRSVIGALVLAVVAAGVLLPGRGDALPRGAQKWLGTWETNFGRIVVHRVYRKKSETPDANNRPQYYWAAEGSWTTDTGDSRTIVGALLERNGFDTMGGCWKPSPEPTSCARILMFRSDDRITGGYWKTCRDYCKSHHPFKGTRTHGVWLLGWRLRQRGRPDGHKEIKTQTGGAGSLQSPDRHFNDRAEAVDGSRVFHIDEIAEGDNQRIDVRIDNGSLYSSVSTLRLELQGRVTSSQNDRCPAGSGVIVVLVDERTGRPDRVAFGGRKNDPEGHPDCLVAESWTSTDPQRVSVHIDNAHESG